jgi:hypothetical protein
MNSRAKGVRGELELAHWLDARGIAAVRGQQRKGGDDSPDVLHALPGIHIECKRVEKLELWGALEQACRECGGKTPSVWFRRSRSFWWTVLPSADFVELLKRAGLV